MSNPFLGEVRLFSFNYPPKGWALCNGQLLSINQNQALFSLLGTTYGGNGQTTFALPNFQGRVGIGFNGTYPQGSVGGEASHVLTVAEMPAHTHVVMANNTAALPATAGGNAPAGKSVAEGYTTTGNIPIDLYGTGGIDRTMGAGTLANTGGSQGHQNTQPYLTLSFCIALQGIFPTRN